MYKWEFPSANNTGTYGLKSYQETFKDNPMLSLAKEICQNSLDAVDDENKPVVVEFNYFNIPTSMMPGYDYFIDVLGAGEYFNKVTYKNNDAKEFYSEALGLLYNDTFACLRISDFNTKGLSGADDENNSDWTNLVKAVGVSDKGDGKGGSFGHGKFATFACSYLQTVFYSTNSIDGFKVSQGVARLSTFYDIETAKYKTLGIGYYGNPNCSKMNEICNFDPSYTRPDSQHGTDIFIMGFNDDIEDWKKKIIASILDTFYVAILNNKLIFKFGPDMEITADNISDYIFSDEYTPFLNENTRYNFAAYHDDDKHIFKASIVNENDVLLYFKKIDDPNCNNHVAMFRKNGMKIYDQDRNPKTPFYGATFYIINEKTDAYFRKLENPQHNGWSTSRAKRYEQDAIDKIRKIKKFIKDSVNKFMEENRPDAIDVSGLSEFLPDDFDSASQPENMSENLAGIKDKKIEIKKTPVSNKKKGVEHKNEETNEEILVEILKLDGEDEVELPVFVDPNPIPPGPNPIPPTPVPVTKEFKILKGTKSQMYYNSGFYNLSFSCPVNTECIKVEVVISGETIDSDELVLSDVKTGGLFGKKNISIHKNYFVLNKISDPDNIKVQFKIESDEIWPIEVKYYVVEK